MGSSEAERLGEACRTHERVHAEGPLSYEEKAQLSYLLGITAGQAVRIDELRALASKERERVQQREATIAAAREVIVDYFDSVEPRSTQHAMQALRRIICEGE